MITLVLFLSTWDPSRSVLTQYKTDRGFSVTGAQTNEAPAAYAVNRLAQKNKKIDRIIALVTPAAKESALEKFKATMTKLSPSTKIIVALIPNDVTATELLSKTLKNLLPIKPPDSVILDTTGGFRNAVNALTLLSRFLRYEGVDVEFSTYSDFTTKRVTDTGETDGLFELLDAVNIFATTGNARAIKDVFPKWKLAEKIAFFRATQNFYDSLLICRASRIEVDIKALQAAIDGLAKADYDAGSSRVLVFKELVLAIVEQKMTFLSSPTLLLDCIKWCGDNGYLQQAVTFLKESVVKNNSGRMLDRFEFNVLRYLRNNINHASKKPIYDENATPREIEKVTHLLDNPNDIKGFVESLLTKIKEKSRMRI
ncbi:MAG: TM1812 family CRISPR-associated protein [Clostridiales bacterium]|jgi:hypothetical protein|nr:TM1812 family CRISPR-associated protein [Clostridiales bacterium]